MDVDFTSVYDGDVRRLQICLFDKDFYLQQVQILHSVF